MNIREHMLVKPIDFNLTKRDNIKQFVHKEILNEDFNPDKMVLGDISWSQVAQLVFLDKVGFKDNIYYIYYSYMSGKYEISSKDDNVIPKEVIELVEKTIFPRRMKELTDLEKEIFEEKHKGEK